MDDLQQRLQKLDDAEAIKAITCQYWRAVDSKDPELLRDVFCPDEVYITFDDLPEWRCRDRFVKAYSSLSLDDTRQENHFGLSPIITVDSADTASGRWRLLMFGYNFATRIFMRVTGEYSMTYARLDGRWLVRSLVFKRHSLYSEAIGEDGAMAVPDFGGISPAAHAHLYGKQREGS
jgi:hypothetical protein